MKLSKLVEHLKELLDSQGDLVVLSRDSEGDLNRHVLVSTTETELVIEGDV